MIGKLPCLTFVGDLIILEYDFLIDKYYPENGCGELSKKYGGLPIMKPMKRRTKNINRKKLAAKKGSSLLVIDKQYDSWKLKYILVVLWEGKKFIIFEGTKADGYY